MRRVNPSRRADAGSARGRAAPSRPARRYRVILGVMGAGMVAATTALWQLGLADRAAMHVADTLIGASGDVGLRIENVLVEGRAETGRTALLKAFGHGRGDPVFAVDTRAARARIEALPWVRTALVERRLPDTVYLRLTERIPMALWQRGEGFVVVDWDGVVVEKDDVTRFRQLPVIVGDDAPKEAGRLFTFME
jgi:cell division protein FtsQ